MTDYFNLEDYNTSTNRLNKINFEELFRGVHNPQVLNDLSSLCVSDASIINELIRGKIGGDIIPTYPQCECGSLKYGWRLGEYCNICGTTVKEPFAPFFNNNVWFRAPAGVAPFINPGIWFFLSRKFTVKQSSFLVWLVKRNNREFSPSAVQAFERIHEELKSKHPWIKRNWNDFANNFVNVIEALCTLTAFAKVDRDAIMRVLSYQKNNLFTRYLPTLHSSLYALEDGGNAVYTEHDMSTMAAIAKTFTSIEAKDNFTTYTPTVLQNKVARATTGVADMFVSQITRLTKKPGAIRQHILSSRFHFSIRAVISSKTRDINYRKIDIAWPHAIHFFREHLINKLYRAGYCQYTAIELLHKHELLYSPLLDKFFQEIIAEAGPDGLGVVYIRYPTLSAMSNRYQVLGRVKTDVNDHTTDMSIGVCPQFNADFDGDQMAILLLSDNRSRRAFQGLDHSTSVINPIEFREAEGILNTTAQVTLNIANMIRDEITKVHGFMLTQENINFLRQMEV